MKILFLGFLLMAIKKNTDRKRAILKNRGIMTNLINNWLSYVRLRFSPATFETYSSAAIKFLMTLPNNSNPTNIKTADIEKYIQNIVFTGDSISTANTYLAAIKSFYKWAEKFCDIPNIAEPVTALKIPPKKHRIISDDEYSAILNVTHDAVRDGFQFLANTGLRRDEFRNLCWQNFNNDYIHIHGKGNKPRAIPLNQICKQIINRSHSNEKLLFIAPFQNHTAIYTLCARVSKKANISYFTLHSLRHYFATRLIRNGVPLIVVSKILGHANTQITEQIYVHLVPADLRVTDVLQF